MIFVDTWAWLALAYRKDPYHDVAARQHGTFHSQGRRYITTDYVLTETLTALFKVVPFDEARRFVDRLLQTVESGPHRLVFASPDRFRRAWKLRVRYRDKPDISFVDLTSIAVMQELGISDIFTGDAHFRHVGLGFRLFPSAD